MTDIRTSEEVSEFTIALSETHYSYEVDDIVVKYQKFLNEHPFLYLNIKDARKRIKKLWIIQTQIIEMQYLS